MNTPGSVAWSCIRTRSPRIAPPVNGDDGSIASTATSIVERPQVADQGAGQRALARPGRTGHADGVGRRRCARAPAARPGGRPRRRARSATAGGRGHPDHRRAQRRRGRRDRIGRRHRPKVVRPGESSAASSSAMLITSVTPSTRSRMMRSMPPLSVCVETGHVPQAPTRRTVTTPVASSTSISSMSPWSAWRAGRMTSMQASTWERMTRSFNQRAPAIHSTIRRRSYHAGHDRARRASSPTRAAGTRCCWSSARSC